MAIDKQLYTLDEYHRIIDMPENQDRILELIDGELVEKMPSFTPSRIASRISYKFNRYLEDRPIGYITGEAGGYIMSSEVVFNPDVGYISKVRLPEEPEREAPVPPDLAVEVKSPTDSKRAMRRKAERYLELGTRIVWLVFPDERVIEVYMPDEDVKTLAVNDTLDGGEVLPGFTLSVSELFLSK